MTDEKTGKEPYPDDMPKPSGWPDDDEELPIRATALNPDDAKEPYPAGAPDGGWPADDEVLRKLVVKDFEELLDNWRESIYADAAPNDPSQLNEGADGDRAFDELFGEDNDVD